MSCCGRSPKRRVRMKPKIRHIKPSVQMMALMGKKGPDQKRFLMCRPSFYGVEYQINPWMDIYKKPDKSLATEQWTNLHDRILEYGGDIVLIKDQPGLPDMVFTANGGTVFPNKKAAISNFKHQERKGEEEWFVQWFAEQGYDIFYPSHMSYEGAGDALYLGDTLVCGTGFRSDEEAHGAVGNYCGDPIVVVKLVDPHFYHLDTCFCPLEGNTFMIYPGAFDKDSFDKITQLQKDKYFAIIVPEKEAKRFACNAVCIEKNVILPSGCPETEGLLKFAGYKPVPVDMSEFIKAGGACKCLTLELR